MAQSQSRRIHVEWQQQSTQNVAGYRLYMGDVVACSTPDANATAMDCTVEADEGEALFTLTAYSPDGAESSPSSPYSYTFSESLNAVLTTGSLRGESPYSVTFDASTSTGNIVSYSWTFGDGEIGAGAAISHTFATPGSYNVELLVTDNLGITDQASVVVEVTAPQNTNTAPTAVISSSTGAGEAPLSIVFDGSGSTDDDGSITSYQWDMGDGTILQGPQVTHTYSLAGTYSATLSVTDDGNLTDSISTPIIVSPTVAENIAPNAVLTASTQQGVAPLAISFDAGQSTDQDGSISSYLWSFGDGSTDTGITAAHIYNLPGSYVVTLQVIDDRGESSETSATITVDREITEPVIPMEIGEILVGSTWRHVEMQAQFVDPVVVAGPVGYADQEPAVIRIQNVDANGFDIRIQEWNYLDGDHAEETIHYLVMERGNYTLSNGSMIEAGSFTATIQRFQAQQFNTPFIVKPVVFTSIVTYTGKDTVTGRIQNTLTGSFAYKLNEQDSSKQRHTRETVDYIAWEPGSGSVGGILYEVGKTPDIITDSWQQMNTTLSLTTANPFFFGAMQSYNSVENATLRYRSLAPAGVEITVEEEQSKDSETNHVAESIGYLFFGVE
jgi:PKD repeat protein